MSSADASPDPGAAPVDVHVEQALGRVTESIVGDPRTRRLANPHLPHRHVVIQTVDRFSQLLFPGFFGRRGITGPELDEHARQLLEGIAGMLFQQVAGALRYTAYAETSPDHFPEVCAECDARAGQVVAEVLTSIPRVRGMLSLDVQAGFDGDPAAQHADEVILCYPGMRALAVQRVAHELHRLDVPLIPRMMSEYAHSVTGIDIHPGARIGRSFFIDHGTGVVIGETTVIGDHCKLYQGVTLGAKSFPKDERGRLKRGVKRHPTLEDHVTVYAGATILGGDTVIGAGSVINGGVFLTTSVPPGHVVRGPRTDITLRSNPEMPPSMYNI